MSNTATLVGSHQWFQQFEDQGDDVMRYFLEPVVLVVNYAVEVLKYKHIVMAGLSGGGWTTTIAAVPSLRPPLFRRSKPHFFCFMRDSQSSGVLFHTNTVEY